MLRLHPRHQRLLLAPLLSLGVALGLVVLPVTSAQAVETSTLTLSINRDLGVFYDEVGPTIPANTFRARGRLATGSDIAIEGAKVTLYRFTKTQALSDAPGEPTRIRSVTTDINGRYEFFQKVTGGAVYLVTFDGDADHEPVQSDPQALPVMRDLNATKRTVRGKVYLRGDVNPQWNDRAITLQRKTCGRCDWKNITTRSTGGAGGWSFRVYFPSKVGPVWTYRAVVRAAGDFERSFSAQLTTERRYG